MKSGDVGTRGSPVATKLVGVLWRQNSYESRRDGPHKSSEHLRVPSRRKSFESPTHDTRSVRPHSLDGHVRQKCDTVEAAMSRQLQPP